MKTLRFLILPIVLSLLGGSGLLWAQGAPSGIPQTLRVRSFAVNTTPSATSGVILSGATYDSNNASNAQIGITNTTAGCASDLCTPLHASNGTDANFSINLTDVGAAVKFAQLGPTLNIPLNIRSRATSQELLKISAISFNGVAGCTTLLGPYNATSCARSAVGTYTVNLTAANFTALPVCTCMLQSNILGCGGVTNSAVQVALNVFNLTTAAATDSGNIQVICTGQ